MGNILRWSHTTIRQRILDSNRRSANGSQQFLIGENAAIRADYELIACPCDVSCWCRRHLCAGHYRIKEITFHQFLETYTKLWIPPKMRENVKIAVLSGIPFAPHWRQRNSLPILRWLRVNWSGVLATVRDYNKCGLCDSPLPDIVVVNNLYEGKMWSQLLYDSVVPFDTNSRKLIKKSGYTDPMKNFKVMNREMFNDLKKITEEPGMDVESIRNFDSPWDVVTHIEKPRGGQPLSRVLDKMFYAP